MKRSELNAKLNAWLQPEKFRDVAENGLQIEGRENIERIICGVSANQALIDAAVEKKADAIFVHHGLVWGGGIRALKGWLAARVRTLMANEISLFAYHLPLDAHPQFGNNAGLADALELGDARTPFGEYKGQAIGIQGELV
jgi:putative NIF3 family GTP cyclohydrolase 1 type 2